MGGYGQPSRFRYSGGMIEPLLPVIPVRAKVWMPACARPRGTHGDTVRSSDRSSVENATMRDGVRLGADCWRRLRN